LGARPNHRADDQDEEEHTEGARGAPPNFILALPPGWDKSLMSIAKNAGAGPLGWNSSLLVRPLPMVAFFFRSFVARGSCFGVEGRNAFAMIPSASEVDIN